MDLFSQKVPENHQAQQNLGLTPFNSGLITAHLLANPDIRLSNLDTALSMV